MTKKFTTTDAVPVRVTATHYRMDSANRPGITYDLFFSEERGIWECNCPDVTKNYNDNCKHRRRLKAWIAEQETASLVQSQATGIADAAQVAPVITTVSVDRVLLDKIAHLEALVADQEAAILDLQERLRLANSHIYENHTGVEHLNAELYRLKMHGTAEAAAIAELTEVVREAVAELAKKATRTGNGNGGRGRKAAKGDAPLSKEDLDDKEMWEEYERIAAEQGRQAARAWMQGKQAA